MMNEEMFGNTFKFLKVIMFNNIYNLLFCYFNLANS